jgi:CheY-like chemotaxis protein
MVGPRRKILCIEDDYETAALIAEAVTEWGFEPIVSYSGTDGFAEIIKHQPDLVLCDVKLPYMSGFEVLERLNEIAPQFGHIPFVFLTAMVDREDELRGRRLGADDYITKPIDFDVLHTIIKVRLAWVARNEIWPKLTIVNNREIGILRVRRLDHIQLAMPPGREASAKAFYEGVLGIPEVAKPAHLAACGGCWFEHAELKVHLGVEPDFRRAREAHPAFIVDALFTLADELKERGYRVIEDQPLEGYDRLYVEDPFGNRIELMEPKA